MIERSRKQHPCPLRSRAGITLIEVAVAGALIALGVMYAARQHFYNMRSLAYSKSTDAAASVEEQLTGAVLSQTTTFWRRIAGPNGGGVTHHCRSNGMLPAAPGLNAESPVSYFATRMAAASMANLTVAPVPSNFPFPPTTDMERDRHVQAITRCRNDQTLFSNNFQNDQAFYFCLQFSAPGGQQPLPWDFANSRPFGEFLYVLRDWDGSIGTDPLRCRQLDIAKPRVAVLYYTLYWSNRAPGQTFYRAKSGQLIETDSLSQDY